MDQLVSQLIPTQRIGNDGFNWWVGQIEGTATDEKNNKGGYRFKVRIVGDHPGKKELLDTADLPWATVMMPVTVPFIPGNSGGAHPQLEIGCWVIGFYMDTEKQKPIIMGSIGQTPGATKSFSQRTPNTPPFTTAIPQINVKVDGQPLQKGTNKNTATGGLSDGSRDGDGNARVTVPEKKITPIKKGNPQSEEWCQTKAEKCDNQDMKSQVTTILGEFLAAVQSNGGNIGTYAVNQVTGELNEVVGIARGYVNKILYVVQDFVARVKGFVIEKLQNAVKDLINALLRPSEDGNSLTPVTEFFNNLLKDLGCQMADLGDRLEEWLTNVLMSYVQEIYRAAACQIDTLINGILSKINSLMEDILQTVLGPIQDILGAIAIPLNIIGGAINFVLDLLGISCSGPDKTCSDYKAICTDGEEEEKESEDFLDKLLEDIENLFPTNSVDFTQYVCDEAYTGKLLSQTKVGFTGGILSAGNIPAGPSTNKKQRIVYSISDIEVTEGENAIFVITRTGFTESSSSVKYKTLKYEGTAKENEDYLPDNSILGFAPGETEKTIQIKTFINSEKEGPEDFYLYIKTNSPKSESGIQTVFTKNLAKCTITENDIKNPYKSISINPEVKLPEYFTFEDIEPTEEEQGDIVGADTQIDDNNDGLDDITGDDIIQVYEITADKTIVTEGEFIVYTVSTINVPDGTEIFYTLSGNNITSSDIINGNLVGSSTINDKNARIVVGIEEDGVVEDAEVLRLTLNGSGVFYDAVIVSGADLDDLDEGEGDTPKVATVENIPPSVDPESIITDINGGIIDIPINRPGSPFAEPPYVFIGGEGIGATATALLDTDGFLTEIRVKTPGYGYKKNLPEDKNVRCIIDTFTLVRPGIGYTEIPEIYIDGRDDVAQVTINESGFVTGAVVLNRTITYEKYPEIIIVGGNGFGAKLIPSLSCLDIETLTTIGATKIGTGRYVDCP